MRPPVWVDVWAHPERLSLSVGVEHALHARGDSTQRLLAARFVVIAVAVPLPVAVDVRSRGCPRSRGRC
jgi:hypothetical protein